VWEGKKGEGRGEGKVTGDGRAGGGRDLAHPKILEWRALCD